MIVSQIYDLRARLRSYELVGALARQLAQEAHTSVPEPTHIAH